MNRLSQWNRSRGAAYLTGGIIFVLMLALNIFTPYICDDFTYRLNFSTKEPLGSVLEIPASMYAHSYKMNGRLISHGLAQLFMLLPPIVFDLCNGAVFALTVYLVARLCGRGRNALLMVLAFCMLWCFLPVFGQVVLWQVGALNYFWSLTGLLVYIAPALLRLMEDRELLKKKWHWVAFCIFSFFFGWYSEIASFVGMCMLVCLVVLDAWMGRRKLQLHRLLPLALSAAGYLLMLNAPAQTANKQSTGLTFELLAERFASCNEMLTEHLLILLILYVIAAVLGLLLKLPGKTMAVSALFALAGVCANYMPLAATYYPERCLCTSVLMLTMAILFLAASIGSGRGFPALCALCALALALSVPDLHTGIRDIHSCYSQHTRREQTISAALDAGERDVTANTVIPQSKWSAYWGVRDLTDDPDTWPNHDMAGYYGLDSLIGE